MSNRTVYKYPLPFEGYIEMPRGAKPLHVGCQHDQLFVWALVNPGNPTNGYQFRILGTGHELPEDPSNCAWHYNHLGTVQTPEGYVWHVFNPVARGES